MSPKKTRRKRPEDLHTHLTIAIEETEGCVNTSINYAVHEPQLTWLYCEDDPLIQTTSCLTLTGLCVAPRKRAGDQYRITLYGDASPSRAVSARLKDAQVVDEYGAPQYRTYRGRHVPIFDAPKGLAVLHKASGKPEWSTWVTVAPRLVSDTLLFVAQGRKLYAAVHEMKVDRKRWIQSISIQTENPEAE